MNDALRRVMLAREGAGTLASDAPIGRGRAEHPVCGDEVAVEIVLGEEEPGRQAIVADLAWQAVGCPATLAVAAAAREALVGAPVSAAAERLRGRLDALGGLAAHEGHAEKMMLRAFDAAAADLRTGG